MRNRRRERAEEDNFEERRKRRAENSEILRRIAEKFENNKSSFSFTKKESNEEKKVEERDVNTNQNTTDIQNSNNNSIYARKFEVSEQQKKALEDFFNMNNNNKIEYGKNSISRRDNKKEKSYSERYMNKLNDDRVMKEETVLSNLLLEESEVAIDKDEAKKIGIDSKELEYSSNIDNIDIEGKPIMPKKEVFENIHDEDTKVVHEKKNILYMSLMIIEVLIIIIVVSYAIIRVKKPEILKYFTFIPVEKVLLLEGKKEEKKQEENSNNENNGVNVTEGESKYNIKLKLAGKEYNVINNAKKIEESVILLGTRTNIDPEKQHLVIASQNVEGRLSKLEELKKGEKIVLVVNGKEYNYEINSVKKVNADDIEKIEDKNKKELTLITNAEEGKRVVVYAK
ncbi:MAG: sortase [Clostridiales bacterium]|nr:sortase [Clostridiales bacterium]